MIEFFKQTKHAVGISAQSKGGRTNQEKEGGDDHWKGFGAPNRPAATGGGEWRMLSERLVWRDPTRGGLNLSQTRPEPTPLHLHNKHRSAKGVRADRPAAMHIIRTPEFDVYAIISSGGPSNRTAAQSRTSTWRRLSEGACAGRRGRGPGRFHDTTWDLLESPKISDDVFGGSSNPMGQ